MTAGDAVSRKCEPHGKTQKVERNAQIWSERQAGDTYKAIGERHGISPHRVRYICIRIEGSELAAKRADLPAEWEAQFEASRLPARGNEQWRSKAG